MSRHQKIFLSHSHRDRHSATELQAVLETHGAETYLDQDQIQAGDILPERIREGISWCDIFLLIWSSSAAASGWVEKEWDTAYDLRKKIIPYSLDSAPLPAALQNLVRVEADDRERGDAKLLMAVFGRDFTPDPTTLFPGNWRASMDASGMVQATYDLELRTNGQVEGKGGISNSGVAGQIAGQMGMSGLLSMRIPFHGSWSYDRGSKTLTIETSTGVVFGQQQNDTIRIRATGHEKGAITGQDLAGRTWTLRRVGERARSRADDAKQEVREGFQKMVESAKDSPVLVVMLAAYCLGSQEKSKYDLGLPTDKARRGMQKQGG
ncbi:MAG: toll/interleukin-1 receptor domain-containing protein, partial [Desulfobacteraceae bacterium]|nr:toll/interleukin-1 receptor domain-containing protein [Desulfobacteraceae bacterium]